MPVSAHIRRRGARAAAGAGLVLALLAGTAACGSGSSGDADNGTASSRDASGPARPTPEPSAAPADGPDSVAALGDSITTGFDTCDLLADCPEASWSTGTEDGIDSLAQRLLDDPAGRTWNHAVSGAVMADLPGQARKAVANEPGLVTVLIGGNDACTDTVAKMTPVADFERDFRTTVDTLRKQLPDTRIFVASVPDLMRLWTQGRGNESARQVWDMGICQSMLRDPLATDAASNERRDSVAQRVKEYNAVLKEVCEADEHCTHDDGAVHEYRFTAAELSGWDWFHPSRNGQRVLARLAYEAVTSA
ncbi:GDSL-type esterase/lipase family protein [Streptomyces sp. 549]|uniref:SGNH/GDSL hydrolase family protein n=1 Tax=Streptomyces sp. 549 TaxID=3049076 RepID=UPI0024C29625|nr:GDSL-type esterase/lipase family protein [Streptomyces sp. 549]MDK1473954.1 GDSL-type esterase/lipase family protein [Streptomyces sp. 549]